ncbi:hypothetical protein EAH89_19550 [Roseomonas nepalensis]|uniref:DNA-binding protein n=1 Tax=Muricoccus nepalensis TaxID=1854500 RepID=A0A502FQH3_9PROT|nr:helix-turn-helix domain-containing protein [Roseomonas nepalensis]TPG51798.1 hypothetical protein EAH89_19550 [Roseomonas nepalensis]
MRPQNPIATLPWRECANVPIATAAQIIGCSPGRIYALATEGCMDLVKLAGRTLVPVESLTRFLDAAEPYRPDGSRPRGASLTRARARAARPADA